MSVVFRQLGSYQARERVFDAKKARRYGESEAWKEIEMNWLTDLERRGLQ